MLCLDTILNDTKVSDGINLTSFDAWYIKVSYKIVSRLGSQELGSIAHLLAHPIPGKKLEVLLGCLHEDCDHIGQFVKKSVA